MKKNFSGKATRQSVSIPLDMMEEVQRHIRQRGINFSAYIQELLAKDLSKTAKMPDSSDNEALVHLAEEFHPTATEDIRKWAEGVDGFRQPFFIYRVLCALHDAIASKRPNLTVELPHN